MKGKAEFSLTLLSAGRARQRPLPGWAECPLTHQSLNVPFIPRASGIYAVTFNTKEWN
jgi:hypothetical protein